MGLFDMGFAPKKKETVSGPIGPVEGDAGKANIKWLSTSGSIAQIYQSGLEYALCNADYEQCHAFVYCKDFLQDVIHSHLYGGSCSIYGFKYDSKKQPKVSLDRLRLLCVNASDNKFLEKVPNVLDFLNQFCKKLKLKACSAVMVANPPDRHAKTGCFLLEASGMWNNAPVLVSMFTLLLRVGFIHKKGTDCMETIKQLVDGKVKPYQNNDRSYVQQGLPGIEKILEHGYRKFFFIETEKNYPKDTNIGTMHNQTGIVAFASGSTKSVCKYWTRRSATDAEYAKELAEKRAAKEVQESKKVEQAAKVQNLAADAFDKLGD